eukprot:TRINITY_DN92971_c0_g1_i1.p1 TRINITY_DN92971_c0_g1~~TRINITY_DN92971_c0_g1_i1.p1  ORF type:complete len:303 (+),score=82.92 TRINITY_DN92971_c0_g1_i1:86-994(+)
MLSNGSVSPRAAETTVEERRRQQAEERARAIKQLWSNSRSESKKNGSAVVAWSPPGTDGLAAAPAHKIAEEVARMEEVRAEVCISRRATETSQRLRERVLELEDKLAKEQAARKDAENQVMWLQKQLVAERLQMTEVMASAVQQVRALQRQPLQVCRSVRLQRTGDCANGGSHSFDFRYNGQVQAAAASVAQRPEQVQEESSMDVNGSAAASDSQDTSGSAPQGAGTMTKSASQLLRQGGARASSPSFMAAGRSEGQGQARRQSPKQQRVQKQAQELVSRTLARQDSRGFSKFFSPVIGNRN